MIGFLYFFKLIELLVLLDKELKIIVTIINISYRKENLNLLHSKEKSVIQ